MGESLVKLIRYIYELIPGKKYLFLALRPFYKPSKFMLNQLYFKGSFKVNCKGYTFKMNGWNKRGFTLENTLFWHRFNSSNNWEKQSIELWIKSVQQSDIILDVGANTGFYSLLAKSVNPKAQILGFEPMKHIYIWYQKNCELNKYDIECSDKALSDKNASLQFYAEKTSQNIYSGSLDLEFAQSHSTKEMHTFDVESITLSEIIKQKCFTKIDLMKIDVEGVEDKVLLGMGEYLDKFRPSILIEILDDKLGARLESIIEPLGYLYYRLNKSDKPTLTTKINSSADFNYFLCQAEMAKKLGLDGI